MKASPTPIIFPRRYHWSPRTMCLTTKPIIIIFMWVLVMSCVLKSAQYMGSLVLNFSAASTTVYNPQKLSLIYFAGFYAFMAVVSATYPIGGFLGDVYCGRHRTVTISMAIIWVSLLVVCSAALYFLVNPTSPLGPFLSCGIAILLSTPGLAGFYSNMIQFSLDQLRDAPSYTLGIFLHWCVWVDLLGETIVHLIFVLVPCSGERDTRLGVVTFGLPFLLLLTMSIVLVLNLFTKHWFYTASINYNPYKRVMNVLKYVKAHKHPVRHSALHWTNGEQPSRFDYAKECYGGPFTSSQVEDVKTLGRVMLVLLAVGPIFVLCVPTSYFIFPFFSFHVTKYSTHKYCQYKWVLIQSGSLSYLIGLVSLPIITWVVYCVLKNRVPKILSRLEIGMILFILCVFSMLLIDIVGHITTTTSTHTKNNTHCLFKESYELKNQTSYYYFRFPLYVLVIPNCFVATSYSLTLVTLLEFISAQAPQPMKGLVFGIFFTIKGSYDFLAAIILIPFSIESVSYTSPNLSCGTSYFFITLLVSLVGLVMFGYVKKRYKYRMRDEEPFPQSVIEEIFERRLQHYEDTEEREWNDPDMVPGSNSCQGRASLSLKRAALESEEVRASEWFVSDSEQERIRPNATNWYGTIENDDWEEVS